MQELVLKSQSTLNFLGVRKIKCDACGKQTFIIFINTNHDKLCEDCYLGRQSDRPKEISDNEKIWVDFYRRKDT